MDANHVTILNVINANPTDVAVWAGEHLLGIRLPEPGPNTAVSTVTQEAVRLKGVIPNRMALATELYGMVSAALANQKVAKKLAAEKSMDVESAITVLGAIQDILYRCIQTLAVMDEGAGRLIIGANVLDRMGRNG
jgi:hypothetical protein